MSHHNRTRQPSEDDEEDDPLDRILKKSGCADLHYKVQVNDLFSFVYQELLHLVFFHMMDHGSNLWLFQIPATFRSHIFHHSTLINSYSIAYFALISILDMPFEVKVTR